MKNQTKEELKQIIRSVFFTGHDQGIHEVEKPDFDMFYRNCWEEKISEALDQIALTARRETAKSLIDDINKAAEDSKTLKQFGKKMDELCVVYQKEKQK